MPGAPEYAELHCHSSYSLLDGASQPEELVGQAHVLGLRALALTDHDNLYVAPSFCRLAEAVGLQPIVGAELTFIDAVQECPLPGGVGGAPPPPPSPPIIGGPGGGSLPSIGGPGVRP